MGCLLCCCAVGAEADDDRISFLLSELEGKDILEVIASGKEKFASVPSGGGVGGGVVVSSGGGGVPAAAAAEEKKEEKKEEEAKEESDDVSVFFMFFVEGFIRSILVFLQLLQLCCALRQWHSSSMICNCVSDAVMLDLQDMGFSLFD